MWNKIHGRNRIRRFFILRNEHRLPIYRANYLLFLGNFERKGKSMNPLVSKREAFTVLGVDLFNIRNRNELKVIEKIPHALKEFSGYEPEVLDIQDIYAFALNHLPPRYKQNGSIVLHEPISDEQVLEALHKAIECVMKNPNHP